MMKSVLGVAVAIAFCSVANAADHGQGKVNFKPAPRHAELAVNLAGTMAVFLFSTWDVRATSEKLPDVNEGK